MRKKNSATNFQQLIKSSKSFQSNRCVRFTYGLFNNEYLYLMVNRQYGSAPSRNTFKRRVRFLFHGLKKKHTNLSIGLMVKPLKKNVTYSDLKNSFIELNKKITLDTT